MANRFTQCRSPIHPANVPQGMRTEAIWTTAVPSRHVSPSSAPDTSRPAVVMFSPKTPLASSRPSCSVHQSRSSRAYAYTAWYGPP